MSFDDLNTIYRKPNLSAETLEALNKVKSSLDKLQEINRETSIDIDKLTRLMSEQTDTIEETSAAQIKSFETNLKKIVEEYSNLGSQLRDALSKQTLSFEAVVSDLAKHFYKAAKEASPDMVLRLNLTVTHEILKVLTKTLYPIKDIAARIYTNITKQVQLEEKNLKDVLEAEEKPELLDLTIRELKAIGKSFNIIGAIYRSTLKGQIGALVSVGQELADISTTLEQSTKMEAEHFTASELMAFTLPGYKLVENYKYWVVSLLRSSTKILYNIAKKGYNIRHPLRLDAGVTTTPLVAGQNVFISGLFGSAAFQKAQAINQIIQSFAMFGQLVPSLASLTAPILKLSVKFNDLVQSIEIFKTTVSDFVEFLRQIRTGELKKLMLPGIPGGLVGGGIFANLVVKTVQALLGPLAKTRTERIAEIVEQLGIKKTPLEKAIVFLGDHFPNLFIQLVTDVSTIKTVLLTISEAVLGIDKSFFKTTKMVYDPVTLLIKTEEEVREQLEILSDTIAKLSSQKYQADLFRNMFNLMFRPFGIDVAETLTKVMRQYVSESFGTLKEDFEDVIEIQSDVLSQILKTGAYESSRTLREGLTSLASEIRAIVYKSTSFKDLFGILRRETGAVIKQLKLDKVLKDIATREQALDELSKELEKVTDEEQRKEILKIMELIRNELSKLRETQKQLSETISELPDQESLVLEDIFSSSIETFNKIAVLSGIAKDIGSEIGDVSVTLKDYRSSFENIYDQLTMLTNIVDKRLSEIVFYLSKEETALTKEISRISPVSRVTVREKAAEQPMLNKEFLEKIKSILESKVPEKELFGKIQATLDKDSTRVLGKEISSVIQKIEESPTTKTEISPVIKAAEEKPIKKDELSQFLEIVKNEIGAATFTKEARRKVEEKVNQIKEQAEKFKQKGATLTERIPKFKEIKEKAKEKVSQIKEQSEKIKKEKVSQIKEQSEKFKEKGTTLTERISKYKEEELIKEEEKANIAISQNVPYLVKIYEKLSQFISDIEQSLRDMRSQGGLKGIFGALVGFGLWLAKKAVSLISFGGNLTRFLGGFLLKRLGKLVFKSAKISISLIRTIFDKVIGPFLPEAVKNIIPRIGPALSRTFFGILKSRAFGIASVVFSLFEGIAETIIDIKHSKSFMDFLKNFFFGRKDLTRGQRMVSQAAKFGMLGTIVGFAIGGPPIAIIGSLIGSALGALTGAINLREFSLKGAWEKVKSVISNVWREHKIAIMFASIGVVTANPIFFFGGLLLGLGIEYLINTIKNLYEDLPSAVKALIGFTWKIIKSILRFLAKHRFIIMFSIAGLSFGLPGFLAGFLVGGAVDIIANYITKLLGGPDLTKPDFLNKLWKAVAKFFITHPILVAAAALGFEFLGPPGLIAGVIVGAAIDWTVKAILSLIGKGAKKIWEWTKELASAIWNPIHDAFTTVVDKLKSFAKDPSKALEGVKSFGKRVWEFVTKPIDILFDKFTYIAEVVGKAVEKAIKKPWLIITKPFELYFKTLKLIFETGLKLIRKILPDKAKETLDKVTKFIYDLPGKIWNWIKAQLKKVPLIGRYLIGEIESPPEIPELINAYPPSPVKPEKYPPKPRTFIKPEATTTQRGISEISEVDFSRALPTFEGATSYYADISRKINEFTESQVDNSKEVIEAINNLADKIDKVQMPQSTVINQGPNMPPVITTAAPQREEYALKSVPEIERLLDKIMSENTVILTEKINKFPIAPFDITL